jgi:hypothetical protein
VNALDAAKTTSDDRGGIESVPILGDVVSERRLRKQLESEEHTDTMLDLLFNAIGGVLVAIWGTAYLSDVVGALATRFDWS